MNILAVFPSFLPSGSWDLLTALFKDDPEAIRGLLDQVRCSLFPSCNGEYPCNPFTTPSPELHPLKVHALREQQLLQPDELIVTPSWKKVVQVSTVMVSQHLRA